MPVSGEEKRRIIDLHFNQGKTIREVSRIMGKSSHDITPITKEHRIQLAQNYALVKGERSDVVQCEQDRIIPKIKTVAENQLEGLHNKIEATKEKLNLDIRSEI